ncbi:hypothetical protein HRI_003203100 [Hibiscus trionum]|uniref:Endonuclease/exonuclease/phosphatase domain-containing protein n=1 Tax=Hibiscus trionum TaxID=183268 RepID=A0A9W7IHB3_HIBTR|nr:hypothetical protein HRI_003203100 [Hibiscus trionum]
MKLLSWNVRGLGKPRTVRRLRHMLRDLKPDVIFFIETMVHENKMANIRRSFGYPNGIDVSSVGRSGGLSIGWKNSCNVNLRSFSARHIDVLFNGDSDGCHWRCTGFYGAPEEANRLESWNLLRGLNDCPETPWLIIGDFNEIMYSFEKQGGRVRSERQMERFRSMIEDCSLDDLDYLGTWFTWQKGRMADNNIRERLDRGLANSFWRDLFPDFSLKHLSHTFSDHCPLLLDTNKGLMGPPDQWVFRFEASWLLERTCELEVKRLWGASSGHLLHRLEYLKTGLWKWATALRRNRRHKESMLRKRLQDLAQAFPSDENLHELVDTQLEINLEMDKEELYWEQRARVNWLRNGDRNTTFFHRHASERRRKQRISKLTDADGSEVEETDAMSSIATNYFVDLFSTAGSTNVECILSGINPCITESMNTELDRDFDGEEVLRAIKSMSPLKSAGEDGLGAIFY